MSTDTVDVGTAANDGTGSTLRAGFQAINAILQKADASSSGKVQILEDTSNGTSKLILTCAAELGADRTWTFPDASFDLSATETVNVIDDDDAATNGTDVYIVAEKTGVFAHLESVTAGDADCLVQTQSTNDSILVTDDDSAASNGVALYFDEDGTAGGRFLCVSPTGYDLRVPLCSGKFLVVAHDASADVNGVAVHVDDDGATADERLLFVSPTDADGSDVTQGALIVW